MTGTRDHRVARSGDLLSDFVAVLGAEQPVAFAGNHQNRRTDLAEPPLQIELVHAAGYKTERRSLDGCRHPRPCVECGMARGALAEWLVDEHWPSRVQPLERAILL